MKIKLWQKLPCISMQGKKQVQVQRRNNKPIKFVENVFCFTPKQIENSFAYK